MQLSTVRLIFLRELRDQLRDRRTIFMVAVLPLLIYPVLGVAVLQFAFGLADKASVVGIVGADHLPDGPAISVAGPSFAALGGAILPGGVAPPLTNEVSRLTTAFGLAHGVRRTQPFPNLLENGRIAPLYFETAADARILHVALLPSADRGPLNAKEIDLMLIIPPDCRARLREGGQPVLELVYRKNDDRSRLAARRLYAALDNWKSRLRDVRLHHLGLSSHFDNPFEIIDPERSKPSDEVAAESMLDLFVRIFPFLLVMWSLAGALYPAVDLCAGEKERGTMETLLISPASREEIVLGKFLTIWLFSAATALLNLASMGLTASNFSGMLTRDVLKPAAVAWCVILALPLSAFFSAVCLAVGAYARSTKEGQYYLMPLFLVTIPLVFLTLAPGVELNAFYSLVPVTGVALLLQRLMTSSLQQVPWLYFVPVLLPMVLYSWLALRWAIEQFRREEVLFREAERLDLKLWFARLFREKEALPTAGQAFFCFALIAGLRWLFAAGLTDASLTTATGIIYLAFVAAPPLFMAVILTTRPLAGLALRLPSLKAVLTACLLAALLLPPLAQLTLAVLSQFPSIQQLVQERQPLAEELFGLGGDGAAFGRLFVVLGVLPAVCEELAFRGFILTGLRRRLPPWTAIFVSSFLFALFHMNVFQALPSFILGIVLAVLATWSGSILPGMLFHLLHNGALLGIVIALKRVSTAEEGDGAHSLFLHPAVTAASALLALGVLTTVAYQLTRDIHGTLSLPNVPPAAETGEGSA